MAPLEHRLPDAGTGQEGHDHRSGRIGEEPPGPEFGVNVSMSVRWMIPSTTRPDKCGHATSGHGVNPLTIRLRFAG